jgi:3-deoxy-7-phosphoheptulonate synthase
LSESGSDFVSVSRKTLADIMTGKDDRLVVVVGPCSIHDTSAALDYAAHLLSVADRYKDALFLVMRVYFEKPRTVIGWRGLIADPGLDGSYQINKGLRLARKLMVDIAGMGLPVGTEFLDTTLGQYYADLVTWGAIGARTVESQVHRELASGLSMPVGFKNRTDGNVQVAVDALRAARHPHWFPSLTREGAPAVLGTAGNDETHLILRGGSRGTNYAAENIRTACGLLEKAALPKVLMVDCSHGNSSKDAEKQLIVAADLASQISQGQRAVFGVMLESNLVGGSQSPGAHPLVYGQSITDACLSWEKTVPVLGQLADAVRKRRDS